MSKLKIAEVRINTKKRLVQIKMNKGANHIFKSAEYDKFLMIRDQFKIDHSESIANHKAAEFFLGGS